MPREKQPSSDWRQAINRAVRQIPPAHVVTYGELAESLGRPGAGRSVGAVMRSSRTQDDLPWHRVVGKHGATRGRIALRDPIGAMMQRRMLEQEGVIVAPDGTVCLLRFGWLTASTSSTPGTM